jgi:hypothetical protein
VDEKVYRFIKEAIQKHLKQKHAELSMEIGGVKNTLSGYKQGADDSSIHIYDGLSLLLETFEKGLAELEARAKASNEIIETIYKSGKVNPPIVTHRIYRDQATFNAEMQAAVKEFDNTTATATVTGFGVIPGYRRD